MKAVLVLPGVQDSSFLANLIDRPFLQHVVGFIASGGIERILIAGPASGRASSVVGTGCQWGITIDYCESDSLARFKEGHGLLHERWLLAAVNSLPQFSLARVLGNSHGLMVYSSPSKVWTGWAVIEPGTSFGMPPLGDRARVSSYLESLPNSRPIFAEQEYRCAGWQDLWKAHRDAQESNLSQLLYCGIEVSPRVWIGRNASVSPKATILSPAYVGENSQIGPGAEIGPFAVVGRDCLVAPRTLVRHAVVAPGTYVGSGLKLDHVLVQKRRLFDVRSGASVTGVDSAILDGVFDFHALEIARRAGAIIESTVASLITALRRVWFNPSSPIVVSSASGRASDARQIQTSPNEYEGLSI